MVSGLGVGGTCKLRFCKAVAPAWAGVSPAWLHRSREALLVTSPRGLSSVVLLQNDVAMNNSAQKTPVKDVS